MHGSNTQTCISYCFIDNVFAHDLNLHAFGLSPQFIILWVGIYEFEKEHV